MEEDTGKEGTKKERLKKFFKEQLWEWEFWVMIGGGILYLFSRDDDKNE